MQEKKFSDRVLRMEKELDNLSEELLNTYQEINLLYRISERLGVVSDVAEIGRIILDEILQHIPAGRGYIMLLDLDTGCLAVLKSRGAGADARLNTPIPFEGSFLQEVFEKGKPLMVNDLDGYPDLAEYFVNGKCRSCGIIGVPFLIVPVVFKGEAVGIIGLCENTGPKGHFLSRDQKLLSAVAGQMGISIKRAQLMDDLKLSERETEEAFFYIVQALSRAAEANDEETGNHILRVASYARLLAEEIGMPEGFCRQIFHFAQMHDVGKIHVHPDILRKPGRLSSDELGIIKTHCGKGAEIIGDAKRLKMAHEIALTHHERWDGSGYPRGLKGEAISLPGRITMLADVYDALRSARCYKPAFDHQKSFSIITEGDGRTLPSHMDPQLLAAFRKVHRKFEDISEVMKG